MCGGPGSAMWGSPLGRRARPSVPLSPHLWSDRGFGNSSWSMGSLSAAWVLSVGDPREVSDEGGRGQANSLRGCQGPGAGQQHACEGRRGEGSQGELGCSFSKGAPARTLGHAWQSAEPHYLHGAGRRPSASTVPEPLLPELRMSEILGAGQTGGRHIRRGQGGCCLPPLGLSQEQVTPKLK